MTWGRENIIWKLNIKFKVLFGYWNYLKISNKRFPNSNVLIKTFLCHSYFMNAHPTPNMKPNLFKTRSLIFFLYSYFINLFMGDEALIVFVPQLLLLNKIFHFINHNFLFCPSIWLKWILITDNSYIEHIEVNLYDDVVFVIFFLFFDWSLFVINVEDVLMFFRLVSQK